MVISHQSGIGRPRSNPGHIYLWTLSGGFFTHTASLTHTHKHEVTHTLRHKTHDPRFTPTVIHTCYQTHTHKHMLSYTRLLSNKSTHHSYSTQQVHTHTHFLSYTHTSPPPHTHTQAQYIFGKTAIAVLTCPVSLWARPQSAFSQAHIHFCCLLSSPFPQSLATLPWLQSLCVWERLEAAEGRGEW